MLSELVIASTLFVNACAVLNFKLNKKNQDFNHFVVESEVKSVGDKVREFLLSLQYFRVFIALWNVFIIFLMLVLDSTSFLQVLLSLIMAMTSDISNHLSNGIDFLTSADLILKKTLTTVPSGRPRHGKRSDKDKDNAEAPKEEVDEDAEYINGILQELRVELDVKRREEERLQKEIADVLTECASGSSGGEQSRAFGMAVSRLNNAMLVVEADTKQLAASLRTISRLADNISSKVSALDVAKTRVVECLQLAGDMHDLGVCSEEVDQCINNEDYEQAAQHIHRFLTLDRAVFQFSSSADKEAGQTVSHSYEVLTNATTRLKEILERKLEAAVDAEDIAAMQRFVKLFPLINEHDSGLVRFGKYLSRQIAKIGEDNLKIMNAGGMDDKRVNVLYADTLFLFFEGIAALLETNQPLIESAYGPDKLLDFINMLQVDIDQIVGKVIDGFEKKRQLEKRLKAAQKILREDKNVDKGERLDALELDTLLSEICLMNTHTEMYWRFVRRRIKGASKEQNQEEYVMVNGDDFGDMDEEKKKRLEEEKIRRKAEREKKLDQLLNRSLVGSKMQELLGNYILLEQYYMEESVRKAIDMDVREEGLLSSVVDDVLFLVRKCVRRATSSGSVDCVCAALNNGVALLETTFYQHLFGAVQTGYPSTTFAAEALQTAQNAYNVIQHGKASEAGPDLQRETFLTAANNAKGTADLLLDLRKGLEQEWSKTQRSEIEAGKLDNAVSQLSDVSRKMHHLASLAMESLCKTVFRPKLKTSCDAYADIAHTLTDSQLAEFEAVDPFIEQFNANLDKQIASFESVLHKENFQTLLLTVCSEVERQMERVIMKCSFNRLGGLQLDREFRQLSAYLSGIAGWTARERCARLAQIVALLNVENVEEAVELREATRTSSIARILSASDAIKVLQLRVDLPAALVQKLEL